ncbi:MAG: DoxX family protein [Bacteroidetes bacterium]|jgi:putative oxidoreductase|nr:DoxX family protein [Bacteroidota bacterium]
MMVVKVNPTAVYLQFLQPKQSMKSPFLALFSTNNTYWYANYEQRALLILRIFVSLLMIRHGFPKLEKLMGTEDIKFYNFLGLGPTVSLALCVLGEFIAPILIILGFRTRLAAALVMFTMAVAAYGAHSGDPIDKKELSMVYMVLFAYTMYAGPGKISFDYWLFKRSEA